MLDKFVLKSIQNVFEIDALQSSHPISVEVKNPDEINFIFDRISYEKGAALIRMIDNFLGTEIFKRALSNYLDKL